MDSPRIMSRPINGLTWRPLRVTLAKAASFLTADQIAQAQRLALQFKPDNATQIPSLQSSPEANPSSSSTPGTEAIPPTRGLRATPPGQRRQHLFVLRH